MTSDVLTATFPECWEQRTKVFEGDWILVPMKTVLFAPATVQAR